MSRSGGPPTGGAGHVRRGSAATPIGAVGVVVPARDEQEHIGRCVGSVLRALEGVDVDAALCVVLDRCTDRTASRAAAAHGGRPTALGLVPHEGAGSVGALRNLGVAWLTRRLATHPPEALWLLSTDADTTVDPGWVRDHLRHAADGAHAVAGLADLDDAHHLSPTARRAYARILGDGTRGAGHTHVYGANLGIRADVFRAVGGFPPVRCGEDHGLAARVRDGGFRLVTALDGRVRTSARTVGRAEDGLAGLLAGL
ncbi:glycosyltransferase family A protein [Pseudonocardia sp.]|uniref:glycosyltransferase n=1 Tax=Pseudonocardia sp. TaxID=60912 RepID=UPI00260E4100|nr:glycosyltransferase family A protein [Pseudonocardia sp.]